MTKRTGGRKVRQTILVACANLAEQYDPADVADPGDLQAFARRVPLALPRAPDVILLQEVVASGVGVVTASLRATTGSKYTIAANAGSKAPLRQTRTELVVRDTAILLNSATMKKEGAAGYLLTRHAPEHKAPGKPLVKAKENAHVLAIHKPSGRPVVCMSVHLAPDKELLSKEIGAIYRAQWNDEIGKLIRTTYPKRGVKQLRVVGGDFNEKRTGDVKETLAGTPSAAWANMTTKYRYRDAVFTTHGTSEEALQAQHRKGSNLKRAQRIDYIFTDGEVVNASHDIEFDSELRDANWYSDHRMLWAEIVVP